MLICPERCLFSSIGDHVNVFGLFLMTRSFSSEPFPSTFYVFTRVLKTVLRYICRGWLGGAKVLCILHHWGVQLILAYSWARPAILVVGKGRGGMFLFLLFLHFHSCSSFFPVPLFHLLYSSTLSSISFLPFSGR